jgi:hypothetical protein
LALPLRVREACAEISVNFRACCTNAGVSVAKGIRRAPTALALVDPGAESPRETWLRLLIMRAGLPAARDSDSGVRRIRATRRAHRHGLGAHEDRRQMTRDICRTDQLNGLGWIVIRVTAEDTPASILARIEVAVATRARGPSA